MTLPLTKQDILRLLPDLVLLDAGQLTWEQVGCLLDEDLQKERHLHSVVYKGQMVPAVDSPWQTVKNEICGFAWGSDAAYDPLREELARNAEAGPGYLLALFSAWLSCKTGYSAAAMRMMAGTVLWGLAEPDCPVWQKLRAAPAFAGSQRSV